MTPPAAATFLEAICREPENVTLRLIYADWLEEQGKSDRAELIRVQHAIEKWGDELFADDSTKDIKALLRRDQELLAEDGLFSGRLFDRYFNTPEGQRFWIVGDCFYAIFRRGFIESISCHCAAWLQHGPTIVTQQPILSVTLTDKRPLHLRDGNGDGWRWFEDLPGDDRQHCYRLPAHLWMALGPIFSGVDYVYRSRNHSAWTCDTEGQAQAALSLAAVNWARRHAGFPPLTAPPPPPAAAHAQHGDDGSG